MSMYKRSGRRGILACEVDGYVDCSSRYRKCWQVIDKRYKTNADIYTGHESYPCYSEKSFMPQYFTLGQVLNRTTNIRLCISAQNKRTNIFQEYRKPKSKIKESKGVTL